MERGPTLGVLPGYVHDGHPQKELAHRGVAVAAREVQRAETFVVLEREA